MRLLLTSSGLEGLQIRKFLSSLLPKPAEECVVFLLALLENEEDRGYLENTKATLAELGLTNVRYFNLADPRFDLEGTCDVVYMSGGPTYSILARLLATQAFGAVKNLVMNGALYFGVSAGSIVAGPDIDIAGWGVDGDTNDVGITDLTGLCFTELLIFPHYRDEQKSEVDAYREKTKFQVIPLRDGEAVFVDSDTYEIIR